MEEAESADDVVANNYNPEVCAYCNSRSYSTVVSGPAVPIIRCSDCGLMRQGWTSEEIKRNSWFLDYAGGLDQFQRQRGEKEAAHTIDFIKISDRLETLLPHKGRLLEIGCAMGTTLNSFREKGWQVLGVDPEPWSCEQARSKYGLEVICAPFQEAGLAPGSFDAVLLIHVIEHLNQPFRALVQISNLIRPGGYLVLETPRYDTLMFKLLRGRERSVIPDHLYYFTRLSIAKLCDHAGFDSERVEAVGRTVTLDRLCFYAAKFLRTKRGTNIINGFSDLLRLNHVRVHINLHDMMRLYLRKRSPAA